MHDHDSRRLVFLSPLRPSSLHPSIPSSLSSFVPSSICPSVRLFLRHHLFMSLRLFVLMYICLSLRQSFYVPSLVSCPFVHFFLFLFVRTPMFFRTSIPLVSMSFCLFICRYF